MISTNTVHPGKYLTPYIPYIGLLLIVVIIIGVIVYIIYNKNVNKQM